MISQEAYLLLTKQNDEWRAIVAKKDAEIEALRDQYAWTISPAMAQAKIDQLQADLDRVIGEAVKFALAVNAADREIPVTYRRQATSILQLPEVQSWRARQEKEAR